MVFLEFKDIKKGFRGKNVLNGISFFIKKGEIFGLIGKSGGGKSTLLKIIVGMINVDKGKVIFDGRDALKKRNYLRKKTGFATQENMLFNELTIRENSYYFGKLYNVKKKIIKKRFNELLNLLGLEGFENTQVTYLSGGMKKRANILVSLIHGPELLILDEPTVGLDSILRGILWKYIQRINKEGTTILVTSHLLDEIDENCNRVAILNKGKIYAMATPNQYKSNYGKNKTLNEIFQKLLQ